MTSQTQALPLNNGISNQLCKSIIDYFLIENIWTKQIFSTSQYTYVKDDLASIQRPSIFCYMVKDEKNSFAYYENGTIRLELHFKMNLQRQFIIDNVYQIVNDLKLIFYSGVVTDYCGNIMHGLQWIGKSFNTDYTKINSTEPVIYCYLDYRVDLMAYQLQLQSQGYDIISPDERIYQSALYIQQQNEIIIDEQEIIT